MSGRKTKAKPPRQARKLRPVVGGPWSIQETLRVLAYISDPCQPDEKYGGFHPNTVICAASAISHIRELSACLREAIEIGNGVVYEGTLARWKSSVRGRANVADHASRPPASGGASRESALLAGAAAPDGDADGIRHTDRAPRPVSAELCGESASPQK